LINSGSSKKIRLEGGGRRLTNPKLEEELADWVRKERLKKNPVSRKMLRLQAYRLQEDTDKKLVITDSWLDRFMNRHEFSLRRKTTVCQKDPVQFIPKIVDFILYVRKIRRDNDYTLSEIYACDETPIWLDFVSETTIDSVGAKEVCVKSTGNEKCKLSVMLCAKANGTKLKPHVIINRVRPIESLKKFEHKLVISYAKKSWFDNELTSELLNRVIGRGFFNKKRLLVWDSFRCHLSESTKSVCKQLKLDMAVIPGGTTKYIQPADVCWNKTFKQNMKHYYTSWLIHGEKHFTKGGNIKAVDFQLICQWIVDSWESVTPEQILSSFKTCGITNAVDGSEDDVISCLKDGYPCEKGKYLLQASREAQEQELIECEEEDEFNSIDEDENNFVSIGEINM